jgi:predicted nucleotidyltransferase
MSESQDQLVLADLKSIFAPLELPIMLVGAGARILVFDRFYKPGRFTEDLDIATQIPDWLTFDAVTQAMTQAESALFQATKGPTLTFTIGDFDPPTTYSDIHHRPFDEDNASACS